MSQRYCTPIHDSYPPSIQDQKMPKTIQFHYKRNLVSLPKRKNASIFFVWLWFIQKVNTNPLMFYYFQQGERVKCRCKRHEAKRLQTKHALKEVRYERKQVEIFPNNKSIKYLTTNKHSRSTIKWREESKKRQGERGITQTVPTKQAARKGNFTFRKKFQAPIKKIRGYKHQIST